MENIKKEKEIIEHEKFCCEEHGCKFNDKLCPILLGKINQLHPCEYCRSEAID